MDTTNQNPQNLSQAPQSPVQPVSPSDNLGAPPQQIPSPVGGLTAQQTPMPNPTAQATPAASEPIFTATSSQTVPSEKSTITLHDLYGPSGFAQDSSAQPTQISQPTQPGVLPSTPAEQTQPPMQLTQENTSAMSAPEMQPNAPTLSNLPTADGAGAPAQETLVQPSPLQATPEVVVPQDMPLRKQAGTESVLPQENPFTPAHNSSDNPPPEEKKKSFLNKFLLLRILFGGLAVVVFMIVILFVVQFFSNFSPSSNTSGKVTLTYWGLWEDANTMQSIISQFEAAHPNITIHYEKEDPTQYSQRVLTYIKDGNGPDIFTYHSSWLLMMQPVLAPLPTSVMSQNSFNNTYYPVVRNDLVKNGALYGIPLGIDTLALFVNNTMFHAAKLSVPTTWDNFLTVARALTVKDANGKIKVAGAAMGTFDNITHAPDILATLFMQNGVDITTMTPSSNAADALSFYTSFASGDSSVWDNTLDPSQLAFARGNLAMYFGYSWDIFLVKASNPSLDFSIYPIPHLPGRNTTAASYWVEGVSNKSAHQKEALLFMQFLAQKNTLATLYTEEAKTRLFGEPYPQVSLGETLKDNPLVYPFVQQAKDARSSFFAGETDDTSLNGQMNSYLGNAVRGVLQDTSPQSAIDTLTQGVEQIEKQYAGS